MLLYIKRGKCSSSLLYSICDGLNSFFSFETQKKMCPMVRKKLYLSQFLKNGYLKWLWWENSLFFMQILLEVEYSDFMREAMSTNIKGSAIKSIFCFEKVLYEFIKVNLQSCRFVSVKACNLWKTSIPT